MMSFTQRERFLMFLFGCITIRLALVVLTLTLPSPLLRVLAVILLTMGIGFTIIFVLGLRRTGPETSGEKIWWNALRPVHAVLYITASYHAWRGNRRNACIALMIDVAIGFVAWQARNARMIPIA